MSKHLMRDLDNLERHLLEMSSRVEEMIQKACYCLTSRDLTEIPDVDAAEQRIDQSEVEIEEECLKILALHQPVASDLRRVTTLLKINNELERIADLAVNICKRASAISQWPDLKIPEALNRMSNRAVQMVRTSLDAFVHGDVAAARHVMVVDDDVDEMNREVIDALQDQMKSELSLIDPAMHCFSATRHLERIADHATNIAEDVLYLVVGEIARHQNGT